MEGRLNGLDLFAGIGGFTIGLEGYVRPIAYVERDAYCVAVLLERMREDKIPVAPICTDIREFRGDMCPDVDVIVAGFPCQDVSVAGRREGMEGERTGLFWEVVRIAKETAAPFVFLENVQGISKHVPVIRNAFEEIGYSCRDGFLSAADIGANHKRERWFMLAYSSGVYENLRPPERRKKNSKPTSNSENVAYSRSSGLEGSTREGLPIQRWASVKFTREDWWATEPNVGGNCFNGNFFGLDET